MRRFPDVSRIPLSAIVPASARSVAARVCPWGVRIAMLVAQRAASSRRRHIARANLEEAARGGLRGTATSSRRGDDQESRLQAEEVVHVTAVPLRSWMVE